MPRCSFYSMRNKFTGKKGFWVIDKKQIRCFALKRGLRRNRLWHQNRYIDIRHACNAGRLATAGSNHRRRHFHAPHPASTSVWLWSMCIWNTCGQESVRARDLPTDYHCHDDHDSLSSRFSSGDLSSELDDEPNTDPGMATVGRQDSSQPYQAVPDRPLQSQPGPIPPPTQPPIPGAPPPGPPQPIGGDLSLNLRPGSRTTSAPSSPAKTRESLLQRVQSLTGAARDQASCFFSFCIILFYFCI